MRLRVFTVTALGVLLVGSCVASAYVHHERRKLHDALVQAERERDALREEWGRLAIERGTLGDHERVLRLARERLDLVPRDPTRVVVLKP